jgi:hypothetical protein
MQMERIFSPSGLNVIFDGELIPQLRRDGTVDHWRPRGFRYESSERAEVAGCMVIDATRSAPDASGVYVAQSFVCGRKRKAREPFFPQSMIREDVLRAIVEAYPRRKPVNEQQRLYKGRSEGYSMTVYMELDANNLIVDAYPKRKNVSKAASALWKYKQTGKVGKHLCNVCLRPKVRVCPVGHGTNLQPRFYLSKKLRWLRRWFMWRLRKGIV